MRRADPGGGIRSWPAWRRRLHEIIFEADTPAGFAFDVALFLAIMMSVIVVMLASVGWVAERWAWELYAAEWFFTVLFTAEYAARLLSVDRPVRYARSFFGVVDVVSIVPTYLGLVLGGAVESLLVVRTLRLLRVFRVFKLGPWLAEGNLLLVALVRSRRKVLVFLFSMLCIVTIMGAAMYVVEGPENGYTSIPTSMYWAIVTITTVGYGDISPVTPLGQTLSSALMILGYAIIAVPTGIVTVELAEAARHPLTRQACPGCGAEGHDTDAAFCKHCGADLGLG